MVYDKRPVTIDEAINKNHKKQRRIKIKMANEEVLILDSIYYKENELYGLFELWVKKGLVKKKPMARSHPKQLNLYSLN